MDFPLEETIRTRSSIRTYEARPLTIDDRKKIEAAIAVLKDAPSPFPNVLRIRLLETADGAETRKLGTYGVIKGAKTFLGVAVQDGDMAMEAAGYIFEKLILYATYLGLGTCWIGGTFNRGEFAAAMQVRENEIFPVISPIGYPAGKRRMAENILRKMGKSDQRKPWEELFFQDNFSTPLSGNAAGKYAYPLEMLRLAPSAVNKQPWRVLWREGCIHFYEAKDVRRREQASYDIHRLDVGIAACHFHLAVEEKTLPGRFGKLPGLDIDAPENMSYLFSWIME